ncbi:hypothetical protein D3C75_1219920 [compost metagenome]
MIIFPGSQTTDTRPNRYANPLCIDIFTDLKAAVLQCLFAGGYRKLYKTVHLAGFLAAEALLRVKICY